jgi:hypothetical protein
MYRANDGSLHYTKESAMEANASHRKFWTFIFCLFPNLIGTIVGFFLGLCFKIGIVGKIITTVLVTAAGVLVVVILTQPMGTKDAIIFLKILQGILLLGALGGIGFWWWKHYEKIRDNSIPYTVKVIQRCAVICFWAPVFLMILIGILELMNVLSGTVWYVLAFIIPFLIALFGTYIPAMTNPEIIDCPDGSSSDEDDGEVEK